MDTEDIYQEANLYVDDSYSFWLSTICCSPRELIHVTGDDFQKYIVNWMYHCRIVPSMDQDTRNLLLENTNFIISSKNKEQVKETLRGG